VPRDRLMHTWLDAVVLDAIVLHVAIARALLCVF
jgi:hypothetical protein